MIPLLIIAVHDYNIAVDDRQMIDCKFAKGPSSSNGHAYPTITLRLYEPENIGKISLHFGGSLGMMDLLSDCTFERITSNPEITRILNHGNLGDIKAQNVPGVQCLLDKTKGIEYEM